VRLFGSRADDNLKGGDIDLLIITETDNITNYFKLNKSRILGKIFMQIEEEKIDITVSTREKIQDDPFIATIYPKSVLIHEWIADNRSSK